jgi:hypothetical protein
LLLTGLLWRNKQSPHISLPMYQMYRSIFHRFLPFKPIVWAMQPLHEKGPYGDAMADDHQLIDAFLVVITVKSAECLVNPHSHVEPTLSQRHSCPELSFKLNLLVVVCGLMREHIGQLFFRDAVEQAELLLDQVDVLPAIEVKLVAMTGIGL